MWPTEPMPKPNFDRDDATNDPGSVGMVRGQVEVGEVRDVEHQRQDEEGREASSWRRGKPPRKAPAMKEMVPTPPLSVAQRFCPEPGHQARASSRKSGELDEAFTKAVEEDDGQHHPDLRLWKKVTQDSLHRRPARRHALALALKARRVAARAHATRRRARHRRSRHTPRSGPAPRQAIALKQPAGERHEEARSYRRRPCSSIDALQARSSGPGHHVEVTVVGEDAVRYRVPAWPRQSPHPVVCASDRRKKSSSGRHKGLPRPSEAATVELHEMTHQRLVLKRLQQRRPTAA